VIVVIADPTLVVEPLTLAKFWVWVHAASSAGEIAGAAVDDGM
jgi:hypothetical protein